MLDDLQPEGISTQQLQEEALKLLKDESINWSMLVMMGGIRLSALANSIIKRTCEEEQVSPGVYEFIIESSRAKAKEDIDLKELYRVIKEFAPALLEEEISRNASETQTQELRVKAISKKNCQITVQGETVRIDPGSMVVLVGSSDRVSEEMDKIITVDNFFTYADDQPVPREQVLHLNHKIKADRCGLVQPLGVWGGSADNKKTWIKMLRLCGTTTFPNILISNLNVAGSMGSQTNRTVAAMAKRSISMLSRWLSGTTTRVIAGAYYPKKNEPDYADQLTEYAANRQNVQVIVLKEDL